MGKLSILFLLLGILLILYWLTTKTQHDLVPIKQIIKPKQNNSRKEPKKRVTESEESGKTFDKTLLNSDSSDEKSQVSLDEQESESKKSFISINSD